MPASSPPSVHEDAPTSRDVNDDQHSSYNPPISTSSQRRLPKLTPARLAFFAATLGLGIPKAVTSAEGQETVANILDLNLGVVWPCVYVIKPTFRILLTVDSVLIVSASLKTNARKLHHGFLNTISFKLIQYLWKL